MLSTEPAEGRQAEIASELAQPAWFEEAVLGSLERARAVVGERQTSYRLAGRSMRLCTCTADSRDPLAAAFEHLRAAPAAPELTIAVWDSASAGLEPPTMPGSAAAVAAEGTFYYHEQPGFQVAYQPAPGALSALDMRSRTAWYWVRDFGELPYWDRATPLRHILHWWLRRQGCLQVHGAAVGTTDLGGALLVGKGGSGKSTSALACLGSALRFAGDDYVAVSDSAGATIYSLYNSAKLEPSNLDRLPHLRPALVNGSRVDSEKAVLHVDGRFPQATVSELELRAILLPRVTGVRSPRVAAASRAEALAALAPSTMFQLHPPRQDALACMRRLVSRVPVFALELGGDVPAIPARIEQLLGELQHEGAMP